MKIVSFSLEMLTRKNELKQYNHSSNKLRVYNVFKTCCII